MNILFAGGGTGGHVLPINTLIEYIFSHTVLEKKISTIYWNGERNSLEEEYFFKLREQYGKQKLVFVPIVSGKIRREKGIKVLIKTIWDMMKFVGGIIAMLRFFAGHKVDVIFCKGGYVALPAVIAGWIWRKKIFLHESDTKPGLSNRIAARFANKIFTGFPDVFANAIVTGQIMSDSLFDGISLGQQYKKTHILIMGGSQGSASLYDCLGDLLEKYGYSSFHFSVVLGFKNKDKKSVFDKFDNVDIYEYCDSKTLGALYTSADVAITRAGTTSLAEQKLFGLSLIMIPIPRTHDQALNARRYETTYEDTIVWQNSEIHKNMNIAINQFEHFKKKRSNKSVWEDLQIAKKIITDEFFR